MTPGYISVYELYSYELGTVLRFVKDSLYFPRIMRLLSCSVWYFQNFNHLKNFGPFEELLAIR